MYRKEDTIQRSMGASHGAIEWKGKWYVLEFAGIEKQATYRCPPEYLNPLAQHHWKDDPQPPLEYSDVMFMTERVLETIGHHLQKRLICWPRAQCRDGHVGLPKYRVPRGATPDMAPSRIEVVFEQKYAPKHLCQEARRAQLKKEYEELGAQGGAGAVISDCIVREVMSTLTRIGVHVTFVRGAEFDGIGSIRVAQGCKVDVPSGDSDMFAQLMGSMSCQGSVIVPGDAAGDVRVYDAKHKAYAMAAFWDVNVEEVTEALFCHLELITLAIVLLGPHDYHYKKTGDKYSNTTGNRYVGMVKIAVSWVKAGLFDMMNTAADVTVADKVKTVMDWVYTVGWPDGGKGKIGKITYDDWRQVFLAFVHQPVSLHVGPTMDNARIDLYVVPLFFIACFQYPVARCDLSV